jgi:hypothetical protein
MTAQIGERLIYQGQELSMCSEPLTDFFALGGHKPDFQFTCTALWRGYAGTWDIVNDRLYLVGLQGTLKDGSEATLETVFPGYPERVFAHWYSGTLRIPDGEQLEYVHMGYASTYERDRLLQIDKGIVVGSRLRHNSMPESDDGSAGSGSGSGDLSGPRTEDRQR